MLTGTDSKVNSPAEYDLLTEPLCHNTIRIAYKFDVPSHVPRVHADAESGIAGYTVGIGTAVGKMDIVEQSLPRTTQTAVLTVPAKSLKLDNVYYATLVAENWAGSTTSGSSDGFMTTNAANSHSCVAIV